METIVKGPYLKKGKRDCIPLYWSCTFNPATWALKRWKNILDPFYTVFSCFRGENYRHLLRTIFVWIISSLCFWNPLIWHLKVAKHDFPFLSCALRAPQHPEHHHSCNTQLIGILFCRDIQEVSDRWLWPRLSERSLMFLCSKGCSRGRRCLKGENMAQFL